ncbi:pseudouridine synthase [Acinetobacter radioresistens]|uniref:pseudouridine synthase n=1 Tax=Acinetobacter radioresistens TaxID=40216 RepID=UPI00224727E3|nr:pseudouridine synthase [Acinetobacter radioresistens]MCX0333164.1 pseudouridine synthase [Acinetobacter radioresistens]
MNKPFSTVFIPPMIDGVSASKVFLPLKSQANTIYEHLTQQFPHINANEWMQRFEDGLVYTTHGQKLRIDSIYEGNQHIYYYRFLSKETPVPFEHHILHETDEFLVVDKPHFLTMSPTGQYVQETLLVRLKKQTGIETLTPIHRLDRETAGVVLFSKRPETRGLYQKLFAERKVEKTYHAVAPFKPELNFPINLTLRLDKGEPFYTMQIVEGESNTETLIDLLDVRAHWAKYQLKPRTGKQHQLRVHLNHLGIPIQNDNFYPIVQHKSDNDFTAPLQLLAKEITFIDPVDLVKKTYQSGFELLL